MPSAGVLPGGPLSSLPFKNAMPSAAAAASPSDSAAVAAAKIYSQSKLRLEKKAGENKQQAFACYAWPKVAPAPEQESGSAGGEATAGAGQPLAQKTTRGEKAERGPRLLSE